MATPVLTSVSDEISVLVHELDGYVRSKAFPENLADATAHFQVCKDRTNRQRGMCKDQCHRRSSSGIVVRSSIGQ